MLSSHSGTSVLLAGSHFLIRKVDYDSDENLGNLLKKVGGNIQTLAYINESEFVISGGNYNDGRIHRGRRAAFIFGIISPARK